MSTSHYHAISRVTVICNVSTSNWKLRQMPNGNLTKTAANISCHTDSQQKHTKYEKSIFNDSVWQNLQQSPNERYWHKNKQILD